MSENLPAERGPSATPARADDVRTIEDMLKKAEAKAVQIAPRYVNIERLTRLMLIVRSRTPALAKCTPASMLSAFMRCAETGLEPIGAGGAWLVPYGDQITFVPDYRGLIFSAKREGVIKHAYADVVYANDQFRCEKGLDPRLEHVYATGDRGEMIGAYCVVVLPDGEKVFEYMGKDQIEAVKSVSKAQSSLMWAKFTSEAWKKTVVRRALKPFATSPSLQAIEREDNNNFAIEQEPIRKAKLVHAEAEPPASTTASSDAAASDAAGGQGAEPSHEPKPESDKDKPAKGAPKPPPQDDPTVLDKLRKYKAKNGAIWFADRCSEAGVDSMSWPNAPVEKLAELLKLCESKKA